MKEEKEGRWGKEQRRGEKGEKQRGEKILEERKEEERGRKRGEETSNTVVPVWSDWAWCRLASPSLQLVAILTRLLADCCWEHVGDK